MVVGGQLTKKTVRAAKSVTKGYSSTQSKVRDATKNDPSSPTARELNEIADLTFNSVDFIEVMEVLDKRLNDKGKLWRHVFKALTVLEYLLYWGSDNVVRYVEDNLYEIKTLREFQYIDDNAVDCGYNVRQKAKEITNLMLNPSTLQSKRRRSSSSDNRRRSNDIDPMPKARTRSAPEPHDDEAKRALAESKRLAEQKRRTTEDQDLQRAIQLSKEEEEARLKAIAASNGALFNDPEQKPKNDDLIDLSDLQISPSPALQVQYTSYQGVIPQYTAVQPQFSSVQPQYTQFQSPYTYQNNEALQAEYLRQQAEWAQQQQIAQQQEYLQQQQLLQLQQQQQYQQQLLQQQQQQQYLAPVQPQPTAIGSNNPFGSTPSPSPSLSSVSTTSTSMSPSTPYSARSLSRASDKHSHLAGLYASRGEDGVDTFGNQGSLRFGYTDTGRLAAIKTGMGNNNSYQTQQVY